MYDKQRPGLALGPIVLIVALFFLWGVANSLNDVLIPQFKKAFTLSDWQSGLVQSAFYVGYFLLALPAGLFIGRWGYKSAVVFGLVLYGAGALLFFPAAQLREYPYFLLALFVIASGLAFLETAANPLMTVIGPPETATRRLNLAQAFNPAGALTGVFVGREFILTGHEPSAADLAAMSPAALEQFRQAEAHSVQGPYLILAAVVLAWAALVAVTRFPAAASRPARAEPDAPPVDAVSLLRRPRFLFGVVAQFFYVGAQVGIWSFMIRYGQAEVPGLGEKAAADVLFWSLGALFAGRFIGTALMGRFDPARLMLLFALANIGLLAVAITVGGPVGLYSLAATSFFMSIMFPTIFALSVQDLDPQTKTGSSLLVMSIIGGAVMAPLIGLVSHLASIQLAMAVPLACFAVVALFSASNTAPAPTPSKSGDR